MSANNSVNLMGRLTKDVDFKAGEMSVARITLAVDRKKKDEADFPTCVAFGKTAEFINKYFGKGSKIAIQGELRTGSYTNKEGKKVYTTDVVINDCAFCEKKAEQPSAPEEFINAEDVDTDSLPFK